MTNPLFSAPTDQKLLLSTLRLLGVTKAIVSFSGSGDSGNIDEVTAINAQGEFVDVTAHKLIWPRVTSESTYENGKFEYTTRVISELLSLDKILEHICRYALDKSQLDWYNNEGGQGQFEIDMTNEVPVIQLNVGVNYTKTEDHTFDFYEPMTEDDVDPTTTERESK